MLLVFQMVFSVPVISQIEYIGVNEREGVGRGRDKYEAKGGLK